jgi:hypothetical protein
MPVAVELSALKEYYQTGVCTSWHYLKQSLALSS